jgi:hypothetical protein
MLMKRLPNENEMIAGLKARYTDERGFEWYLHPEQLVYYPIEELLREIEEEKANTEPQTAKTEDLEEERMMNSYGRGWMTWMESEHPEIYREYRRKGVLTEKALEVSSEGANREYDIYLVERLKLQKAGKFPEDILQRTRILNQITFMAEEIVRNELVYQIH